MSDKKSNHARTHGHPLVRARGSTVRQTEFQLLVPYWGLEFESLHFSKPWFRWQNDAVHVFSQSEDGKMVVLPLMPVSREEEPWNSEQAGLGAESSGLHEASRTGV